MKDSGVIYDRICNNYQCELLCLFQFCLKGDEAYVYHYFDTENFCPFIWSEAQLTSALQPGGCPLIRHFALHALQLENLPSKCPPIRKICILQTIKEEYQNLSYFSWKRVQFLTFLDIDAQNCNENQLLGGSGQFFNFWEKEVRKFDQ